jgi:hypothetical protein
MKKFWRGKKKHIDNEKIRDKAFVQKQLAELLEYTADERKLVEIAKLINPEISGQELRDLIVLFRDAVADKRGIR